MQIADRRCRIELASPLVSDVALLDFGLGLDMRQRQPLPRSQIRVAGKIAGQRLLDFQRARVLPFDAIRVVGIHPAQQAAQGRRNRQTGKLGGATRQIVRLGQQGLLLQRGRQKWLELVGCVVHWQFLCQHNSCC
jgi:hypothetical protein